MPWWGWVTIGIVLFGAELIAIDAHFYLIFIAASAIAVGALAYVGMDMPIWGEWLLFAALSITFMFTLREQLYRRLRGRVPGADNLIGALVIVRQELAPGKSCRTRHQGSTWKALNVGADVIPAGTQARVSAVDGVTLHVSTAVDR